MKNKKIEIITKNAPTPAGPYSQGIIAGDFIFVAGQRPQNPFTNEIPNDIKSQTKQCIENIKAILEKAGSSLDKIVKTNVYLTDIKYFAEMNEIYQQMIPIPFPVRTTIGTQLRNILIEIEVIALRGDV